MLKIDIENLIKTKYPIILKTIPVQDYTIGNVNGYKAVILDKDGTEANQEGITYYVEDEGLKTENAYVMKGQLIKITGIPEQEEKTPEEIQAEQDAIRENAIQQKVKDLEIEIEAKKRLGL